MRCKKLCEGERAVRLDGMFEHQDPALVGVMADLGVDTDYWMRRQPVLPCQLEPREVDELFIVAVKYLNMESDKLRGPNLGDLRSHAGRIRDTLGVESTAH